MKNKLFYLLGTAAMLTCSTGMFTSCVNGVDDEYLELQGQGSNSGNTDTEGEEVSLPEINGDYFKGGENELTLIYNGEELTGKKVTVAADEKNETAVITLAGAEQDLTSLLNGLLEFKFTANSPVPGVSEITMPNVKLYTSGNTSYIFKGDIVEPTYTLSVDGTIEDGKMTMKVNHQLANKELAGTWNLAAKANCTGTNPTAGSPLWVDWNSQVKLALSIPGSTLNLNQPFNGIFGLVGGFLSGTVMKMIVGQNIHLQDLIRNMLQGVTAQPDGCMYATYSYSGDIMNPQWSSEMPRNALRYYYGEEAGKLNLEVNADYIISLIGGLLNPASTRAADPEVTKQLGRELIQLLIPVLKDGVPCNYTLEGDNLTLEIDGVVLRDILRKLAELGNDEYASTFIEDFLNSSLPDMAETLLGLIKTLPDALQYYEALDANGDGKVNDDDYDPETKRPLKPSGECQYVKLGLKFVRQ